jgi:RimJ/RimL family protein N-acetyltransferase
MNFNLRPWTINDTESLIKYAGNQQITRFMSDGFSSISTPEGAARFISFANSGSDKLYRAIDTDGEAVGGIGISVQTDIHRKNAELGYWLAEPFWGNGIISRAIPMIVDEAFRTFDINRVFARPFSNNQASHRVLLKAGFQLEAVLEKTVFRNEAYLDEHIYAMRKPKSNNQ